MSSGTIHSNFVCTQINHQTSEFVDDLTNRQRSKTNNNLHRSQERSLE